MLGQDLHEVRGVEWNGNAIYTEGTITQQWCPLHMRPATRRMRVGDGRASVILRKAMLSKKMDTGGWKLQWVFARTQLNWTALAALARFRQVQQATRSTTPSEMRYFLIYGPNYALRTKRSAFKGSDDSAK